MRGMGSRCKYRGSFTCWLACHSPPAVWPGSDWYWSVARGLGTPGLQNLLSRAYKSSHTLFLQPSPISCYTHVLPASLWSPVSPAHFSCFPPPYLCPYCALCTADLLEPLPIFESSFGNRFWCTQGCLPPGADPQSRSMMLSLV